MAQAKWPVYLYNAEGQFLVCDNPDQVEKAKAKGYRATPPAKPIPYPTTLYDKDGNTKVVVDDADAKKWTDRGFGADYVASKQPVEQKLAVAAPSLNSEMIQAFMAEISSLRSRLDTAEDWLDALEASATEPKKGKKKGDDPDPAS